MKLFLCVKPNSSSWCCGGSLRAEIEGCRDEGPEKGNVRAEHALPKISKPSYLVIPK